MRIKKKKKGEDNLHCTVHGGRIPQQATTSSQNIVYTCMQRYNQKWFCVGIHNVYYLPLYDDDDDDDVLPYYKEHNNVFISLYLARMI